MYPYRQAHRRHGGGLQVGRHDDRRTGRTGRTGRYVHYRPTPYIGGDDMTGDDMRRNDMRRNDFESNHSLAPELVSVPLASFPQIVSSRLIDDGVLVRFNRRQGAPC